MLQSIHTVGIAIKVSEGVKTLRAVLLTGILDLVAKAPIVNMNQYNGKYVCLVQSSGSTLSQGL